MLELESDPSRGKHRVLGAEIGSQLVDDIPIAAWLQLGLDNLLRIGLGGIAEKAQLMCPQSSNSRLRRAVILNCSS